MKIGLTTCFNRGTIDGKIYNYLYENFIKFDPYSFNKNNKGFRWNKSKHVKEIANATTKDRISFLDETGNFFLASGIFLNESFQAITIEQDYMLFDLKNSDVEDIINYSEGFISANLFNVEYTLVQSNSSETIFEDRQMNPEILGSLSKTPFKLDMFGKRDYDVRFNPGREVRTNQAILMASWKMWFGKAFFEIIPKQRLLSFPYAIEVKELKDDLVYIQLFDKVEESHTTESVFRQWKWQEWIDYDKLVEQFPD